MPHQGSYTPLLQNEPEDEPAGQETVIFISSRDNTPLQRCRQISQDLLASRLKHFVVMGIVALDVVALLANVFIQLIACEMHQTDEPWVEAVTEGLEIAGLVFSSLFVLELLACLFAFGFGYLASWFHFFDAAIIIASFVIDIASKGLTESIGSLIVVLRLWRLAKISEEVIMGAAERMEILEQQLEEVKNENKQLRSQLHENSQGYFGDVRDRPIEEV